MKNMKRILLTVVSALLLMAVTVAGTLAYLQATTNTVQNTFTSGNVTIEGGLTNGLTEAQVDKYGNPYQTDGTTKLKDAEDYVWSTDYDSTKRVQSNNYKLLPGHTYVKDPTVTIAEGSEEAYVRMIVTVENYASFATAFPADKFPTYWNGNIFLLQALVDGWDADVWVAQPDKTSAGTYEFWYATKVDAREDAVRLPALFTHVVLPNLTNDQITALNNVKINIIANAIQADGFADQADAWNNGWNK